MDGTKKKKIKEVRKKLSDIINVIEILAIEEEKQLEIDLLKNNLSPAQNSSFQNSERVDDLFSAVEALNAALLLLDSSIT